MKEDLAGEVVFVRPGEADTFRLKGIEIDTLLKRGDCRRFSAYLVRMAPHQLKKPSYHKKGEELYYVVSGAGTAELGEQRFELTPGCFFRVPPGVVHTFRTGDEPLHILNFHSPPVFSDHDTYFSDEDGPSSGPKSR